MEKLLIIGGPNFIGRVLLEALAKQNRFEVTLFNRGITNASLFPEVRRIVGDRNTTDVQRLATEKWDYVIDVACFLPGNLPQLLASINADVKHYVFISTVSVYKDEPGSLYPETAPTLAYDGTQDIDQPLGSPEWYGPRKAECERMLQNSGLNHTILRPALIYGSYDWTDRLSYWLYQVRKKETLFVPEGGTNLVAFTYVRDLVKTILQLLQQEGIGEVFNTVTAVLSIANVVQLAKQATGLNPTVLSAPKAFLDEENLSYWSDLPLWLDNNAIWSKDKFESRFGDEFTELGQSLVDTVAYYESINWPEPPFRKLKDERYDALVGRLMNR